ncbi:imidazolonepropionase [Chitinophaga sp. XS-30]|uniref:imidazolonepropionase n=1 Tax=Chitinophaga sp. XS-30 TaxID=2604421 RepID=UPI0011DE2F72|nr:imidazolonepropionase [Chitinophaga sp. XS-30]QEH41157.1 imidazolonepropionase [Chitinophaga sp. XS-30]
MKLIGPFSQILLLQELPLKGALKDEQLTVIEAGGILLEDGKQPVAGTYTTLQAKHPGIALEWIDEPMVLLPGFVDCHTHICHAGTRSRDYAMRIAGKSYLDIARAGGGIWDSVMRTREAEETALAALTVARANRHLRNGVTTIEVKSGYGLNMDAELKMLRAIRHASLHTPASLIPTCLAAHMQPKDFTGHSYLQWILNELLPLVREEQLGNRVDIFIEETAFSAAAAKPFLLAAKAAGFQLTVHADQFSSGGSAVAVETGALSADHLEASTPEDIRRLAKSDTVAVVLPGASLGLGMPYAPARRLLDAGACVAIASDWNPGSAPMGELLMQAAVMSAAEKLSTAEVFAGLTFRAAKALGITPDPADMQAYPCGDYRDILYYQGSMKPAMVWKAGHLIDMNEC